MAQQHNYRMNVLLLVSCYFLAAILITAKSAKASSSSSERTIISSSFSLFNNVNKHSNDDENVMKINPTYASFNIDASYNRGFFHINFTNPNLLAATKSLAPFILRFGGTGNDYLHYDCETGPGEDNEFYGCLNSTHRSELFNFVSKARGKFLFGVSFDMKSACDSDDPSSYVWSSSDFSKLVESVNGDGDTVWGFELGNEVNNRGQGGNAHCGKSGLLPHQQANALNLLYETINILYPDDAHRPVVIGPSSGYYKPEYWLNRTLSSQIGPKLYAVTHHVYPGINRHNYNDPSVLDRVLGDIKWYVPTIRQYSPQAQIWAGENGPTGGGESGTCGSDDYSICGLYGSVLWYADDMCLRAQHGFSQYQRQDLLGGRYSLVGIDHDNQFLSDVAPVQLHPDFWINFLWKRLIGQTVLNVSTFFIEQEERQQELLSSKTLLRVYAFMGKPPSKYSIPSNENSITFVIINLNNATATHMSIKGLVKDVVEVTSTTSWMISPEESSSSSSGSTVNTDGGPYGNRAKLNGILLRTEIENGQSIDNIPVNGVKRNGNMISIDPISVAFVRVNTKGKQPTKNSEKPQLIRGESMVFSTA